MIHRYRSDWRFILYLSLATLFVYSLSWGNSFISDDFEAIVNNPHITSIAHEIKTGNLTTIVFSVIYIIVGPIPVWFHIHNTLIHVVSLFFVYTIARMVSQSTTVSRFTTLAFALHPIETEAVTWISAAPYAVATLLKLIALHLFISVDKGHLKDRYVLVSTGLYIMVLRLLPISFVFPEILLMYIFLFSSLTKKKLILVAPYIIVTLLYSLSLYGQLIARVQIANPGPSDSMIVYNPLIQLPTALGTYLQLLLFPYNLSFYHPPTAFSLHYFLFSTIATLLILMGIVLSLRKNRIVAFGLSWFIISLAPTVLPINIGWIVAERYVHFASIGFFLAGAALVVTCTKRYKLRSHHIRTILIVVALVLGLLTIRRNSNWLSEDTFWPATYRQSPGSVHALNNMGTYYRSKGDLVHALIFFEKAQGTAPPLFEASYNAGLVYHELAEATKAAELFGEAGRIKPTRHEPYQQQALIAYELQEYDKAEYFTLKSINYNPDPFLDYVMLVNVYKAQGYEEKSAYAYSFAQKHAGSDPIKQAILHELSIQ